MSTPMSTRMALCPQKSPLATSCYRIVLRDVFLGKSMNCNDGVAVRGVADYSRLILCKQGVTGSIPVTSTIFLFCLYCVKCWCAITSESADSDCA